MSRGLKLSYPLMISSNCHSNMILFVNINNFANRKNTYIVMFNVAHLDILDDSFVFPYARGRCY